MISFINSVIYLLIMRLADTVIPGTEIENWIALFGSKKIYDYGLEFLTATTYGDFVDIPNDTNYPLPDGVESVDIEHTVRKLLEELDISTQEIEKRLSKRLTCRGYQWKNGSKPPSVRTLDVLREDSESRYYIDFLRQKSYDGERLDVNGIPYSAGALPWIAYLTGSIIAGGWISNRLGSGLCEPTIIDKKMHKEKLGKAFTGEGARGIMGIKMAYARVLQLLGFKVGGNKAHYSYDELGLRFLEDIRLYLDDSQLEDQDDVDHAINVIEGFVAGVLDHRMRSTDWGPLEVRLPNFVSRTTANKFHNLFIWSFELLFPELPYRTLGIISNKVKDKGYYTTTLRMPKEYQFRSDVTGLSATKI